MLCPCKLWATNTLPPVYHQSSSSGLSSCIDLLLRSLGWFVWTRYSYWSRLMTFHYYLRSCLSGSRCPLGLSAALNFPDNFPSNSSRMTSLQNHLNNFIIIFYYVLRPCIQPYHFAMVLHEVKVKYQEYDFIMPLYSTPNISAQKFVHLCFWASLKKHKY